MIGGLAILPLACKDGAPEARSMTKDAGDLQTGVAGAAVPVAPRVKLMSGSKPVANARINFIVRQGSGTVTPASVTTDANGLAAVTSWVLGQRTGLNELFAMLDRRGSDTVGVAFTATAGAGPAAILEKVAGDNQTGTVGQAVATLPRIAVLDQFRNPVQDNSVTFSVGSGGGTMAGTAQVTNAEGLATLGGWVLGTGAGAQTGRATATGQNITGNPATFTVTANAGAPANIVAVEGNNQAALATRAVAVRPRVKVTDMFGNSVSQLAVLFAVTAGGGTITGATQNTGADGTAAVGSWNMGANSGVNRLNATATGNNITGNPIVFTADATAIFNALKWVGTWSGGWTNTTFNSTGTSSATIAVDTIAKTVSLTFSSTGFVFGFPGGVAPQTRMSTYNETGVRTNVNVNTWGNVNMEVDGDGKVDADGKGLTSIGIECWEMNGTITQTQMILDWVIYFLDGSEAHGRTVLGRA
jgi:adhesin/invasin